MAQKNKAKITKKGGIAAGVLGLAGLVIVSILNVEGGYVDNKNDPGGKTNFGVTENVARSNNYRGDMRDLTQDKAVEIYISQYIDRPGYGPLVEVDFWLAEEIIDGGVNAGPRRASRWAQESLNHFNRRGRDYKDVAEDGRWGPESMRAYNALRRKRGDRLACILMVRSVDAKQFNHYARLAGKNSKFEEFMIGWTRTRVGNIDTNRCGTNPEIDNV